MNKCLYSKKYRFKQTFFFFRTRIEDKKEDIKDEKIQRDGRWRRNLYERQNVGRKIERKASSTSWIALLNGTKHKLEYSESVQQNEIRFSLQFD